MFEPVLYGLAAGTSPSPHTLSLIFISLRQETGAAVRFLLGGLAWDLILIILAVAFFEGLPLTDKAERGLQILSGLMLIHIGAKALLTKSNTTTDPPELREAHGFLVQAFNPNPYIFWFTIGAPKIVLLGNAEGILPAVRFALVFLAVTYALKASFILLARLGRSSPFYFQGMLKLRNALAVALIALGGSQLT